MGEMKSRIEITDLKAEPVRLYKDPECTEPHDGIGVVFTDTEGNAPAVFIASPTTEASQSPAPTARPALLP